MPIIKLDAIDSTNDYLKHLSRESEVKNYTIVMANEQTKGKGQMGAKWVSEKGKNLTMSILVKDLCFKNEKVFDLNITVAQSVIHVLKKIDIPKLAVKWPNDIMSDSKKVAGILIENSLKPDGTLVSVIGIGLNVNQTNFEHLPQATSLQCITGEAYSCEEIAILMRKSLIEKLSLLSQNSELLWKEYHDNLYKINFPSAFENPNGNRFMGIIQKVTKEGKLQVLLDDDSLIHCNLKEIKMLY
ncbi:biotin--[acetyl-CoA-carboxylase] ligase [Flavobacterium sp. 25HG05S-40]|uniref:biotin--[acetyl-CoA-carboxylase] ligase n=1 Tax=Flavobacterium sp. 25HG05S-40 TaxID=3458682 RepID=UPI0040441E5A